jgi:hypothetical protein
LAWGVVGAVFLMKADKGEVGAMGEVGGGLADSANRTAYKAELSNDVLDEGCDDIVVASFGESDDTAIHFFSCWDEDGGEGVVDGQEGIIVSDRDIVQHYGGKSLVHQGTEYFMSVLLDSGGELDPWFVEHGLEGGEDGVGRAGGIRVDNIGDHGAMVGERDKVL